MMEYEKKKYVIYVLYISASFEVIDLKPARRSHRLTSNEDRQRILENWRKGEDLKDVARHLKLNIKTVRSIVETDREVSFKSTGRK